MLWLKNNMPSSLFTSCMFFDLPDWLSYRATGDLARSNCSLGCKCSYVPPGVEGSEGWNKEFFEQIGLEEFVSRAAYCSARMGHPRCTTSFADVQLCADHVSLLRRSRTTFSRSAVFRARTASSSPPASPSAEDSRRRRPRSSA